MNSLNRFLNESIEEFFQDLHRRECQWPPSSHDDQIHRGLR